MKITILSVGKIKEEYLNLGIKEYIKRLGKYTTVEEISVPDEKAPESLSSKDIELIKMKESNELQKKIPDSYVIVLAIEGKILSSTEFAEKIEEIKTYHSSNIAFIIGGSLGLSDELIKRADFVLSFGKLTFPHQLMKLVLLEQIYRTFRINNNEPYHKWCQTMNK